MLTLTAKIRLNPSAEQEILLLDTIRAYRDACNCVSAYAFENRCLNRKTLHDSLYYELRSRFALRSQMAESVFRTVVGTYRSIQAGQKDWIAAAFKKPRCDMVWNRDYSIRENTVSLNTLKGRIKLGFRHAGLEQYFDGTWKYGTAVLLTKHGKWYLHIPVFKEPEARPVEHVTGIDLGIRFLATAYDGEHTAFCSGREARQKRAKYKELRRQLQQRQTAAARRRLKAIGDRENRWMRDVNHCVSKALVTAQPQGTLFVLEDLEGIRKATERVRRKDRYVSVSWAYSDLRKKVEYKAAKYGSAVMAADPKYTSQTCPVCRTVDKAARDKKTHTYRCNCCGYQSNDDRIAAMNLYIKGKEYLRTVAEEHVFSAGAAVSQPAM